MAASCGSLADRMGQGASLSDALGAEGTRLPSIYRSLVTAGLRAGRLPAALESMTGFVQAYVESRRAVGLALAYPLAVLLLAYGLFLLLLSFVIPRFMSTLSAFRFPVPRGLRMLEWLGATVGYWGPVLPVLLILGWFAWEWTGRTSRFRSGRGWSLLRLVPWMGSMLRNHEAANFAELLGVLVEQGVPYPEAVRLASEATGDPAMISVCENLAASIERGEPPRTVLAKDNGLPPLLRWLLAEGQPQGAMAGSLHSLAALYRDQARDQAEKIQVFLPVVLLLAVGMTATLLFGLSLFGPFSALLEELTVPPAGILLGALCHV